MANLFNGDTYVGDPVVTVPVAPTEGFSRPKVQVAPEPPVDYSNGMSTPELALAGVGAQLSNLYRGVTGQPEAPHTQELMQNTPARLGAEVPLAVGSVLGGLSIPGQAIYGAITEGAKPAPSIADRGINALKGAAEGAIGQTLALGLIKGSNAALGNRTALGQLAKEGDKQGITLSAGDIADSSALRLAEEKSFKSPSANQAEQVGSSMVSVGDNPLAAAVFKAHESANAKVSAHANALDGMIATQNLPKLQPYETTNKLVEIFKHNPETIKNIDDKVLRDQIAQMVADAQKGRIPKSLTFTELDNLRRAIGPLTAKIERQSQSGASNVTQATANRWNSLYGSIMKDGETWGAKSNLTGDALAEHTAMRDTFKNDVLPLRNHPIAGKIIDGKYTRPEDIVKDVIAARNKTQTGDLKGRLSPEGKSAFELVQAAKRGSQEYVKGDSPSAWNRPLSLMAAGTLGASVPAWLPAVSSAIPLAAAGLTVEQALVHGLNSQLGRAIVGGSPKIAKSPLANSAAYVLPRQTGIVSGLEALRQRGNTEN